MASASLAMYDFCEPVRQANDALWRIIRDDLTKAGFSAPSKLDRSSPYDALWRREDLVFAQTCGYPYIKQLRGHVRLVGVPIYRFPGGNGIDRASLVVVRDAEGIGGIEDLRNRRVAVNDPMSNSGMNLLRALIAPQAIAGRFFAKVSFTGGHLMSLADVLDGHADVAAIDSVTFGLLAAHSPDALKGVKVLMQTPAGPGLPIISRKDATDAEVSVVRESLSRIATQPAYAAIREPLGLVGFEVPDQAAYDALTELEDFALRNGYPVIN
ncbi:PhnD/SsuA/transferrin family substrate-binding protein [Ciceribacter sp. L1K23]|uniref:phosphate/phosphite/phosphonate ABC transporter substrate-binding protein n=1 Tax=Ciceribacter sp. L1K23 TaxID=2820276 RepID=UPI001B831E73|nr:PhnD/SsuA/transferrin family substrate-binding protein [Ciceribacter sp. L1K23]MBR0557273.1 PhnD/SsuA/transferrin family substrate-binding protein [Ciceribacter sp. L1K23]